MIPTPEFHVANKPFIIQQFLFSNFQGNPRRNGAEQIKNDMAQPRKKPIWLLPAFSRA
jgi:hypothetical protein